MRGADDIAHHVFHRLISLVEQFGQVGGVAVYAEHELGEIVAADGKTIKTLGEFFGKYGVRRHFAHHINLQSTPATHQAVVGHYPQDFVGLVERSAKRHHDDHIFQANLVAHVFERFALQPEGIAVFLMVITRRSAQTEHGILLMRLKLLATDERGVFVCLEIA